MATGNAVDYGWFTYQSNDTAQWSIKCDKSWGTNSASGLGVYNSGVPALVPHGRLRLRKCLLQDPVSGRTTQRPCNPGATALTLGNTVDVVVKGAGGVLTMESLGEIPERFPKSHVIVSKPEPVTT